MQQKNFDVSPNSYATDALITYEQAVTRLGVLLFSNALYDHNTSENGKDVRPPSALPQLCLKHKESVDVT